MKYYSTRDTQKTKFDSAQVIKQGLAADGGLFIPESIPHIEKTDINELCKLSYPQRAAKILSMFLTDYTYDDKNNEIKAVTSDSNGEKTVIYDTTYDEKGNKIKEVATYSDGSKQIYEYAYDDKGSVIMFSYTGSEGYIKKSEITYKFVYIPYDLSEEIFYIINPMTEY